MFRKLMIGTLGAFTLGFLGLGLGSAQGFTRPAQRVMRGQEHGE